MLKNLNRKIFLVTLLIVVYFLTTLIVNAQTPAHSRSKSFTNPKDSIELFNLINNYLSINDTVSTSETISKFTTGRLLKQILKEDSRMVKQPPGYPFGINYICSVSSIDSLALIKTTSPVDSMLNFGWFDLDWYFYCIKNEKNEWRICEVRTQTENIKLYSMLKVMEQDTSIPPMVKPLIVRERSGTLLSNKQLKDIFDSNQEKFKFLGEKISGNDSLNALVRNDDRIVLLNRSQIDWQDASEDMPNDAIAWMNSRLDKKAQKKFQTHLRSTERIKKQGFDTLQSKAKKYKLDYQELKNIVSILRDLRIYGFNKIFKKQDAIQFVTGGRDENIAGFLYSPKGFLPFILPEEYYCLEEIGNNWWIFRKT